MCRFATLALPPEPATSPVARRFLREQLTSWQVEEVLDDVQLVLSELVTNALLHAHGLDVRVTVALSQESLEVAVVDASPVPPLLRMAHTDLDTLSAFEPGGTDGPDGVDGASARDSRAHVRDAGPLAAGRGLLLVEAVALEWGVAQQDPGKAVWARFPTPPRHESCTCHEDHDHPRWSRTLASGRQVSDRSSDRAADRST